MIVNIRSIDWLVGFATGIAVGASLMTSGCATRPVSLDEVLAAVESGEPAESDRWRELAMRAQESGMEGGGAGLAAALPAISTTRLVADEDNLNRGWPLVMGFEGRPQHLAWWTGVSFYDASVAAPEPFVAYDVAMPWEGCVEYRAFLEDACVWDQETETSICGQGLRSRSSNVVIVGDCLDPAPTRIPIEPVPEPPRAMLEAAGIVTVAWIARRRRLRTRNRTSQR